MILILIGVGAVVVAGLVLWPSPPGPPYAAARRVIDRHCLNCHSEHPSIPAFPLPPKDITFDTTEEIGVHAALIQKTVVETRTRPIANQNPS